MLLKLVVMGTLVILTYLLVSQIIIPSLLGIKLFPAFRKATEVEEVIEDLQQKHQEFDQVKYANDLAGELINKIETLNKDSK